ncbi:N-glycosylase/DNA lyase [Candidatus Woesearchaeota archaeon]|nr:N-glycosylase/DNA lyase [Candidatus Woesearchaeota archaeon]
MTGLVEQIKKIKEPIRKKINARLAVFSSFRTKSNQAWFSELCFCILTANSKAITAINIQKELGNKGFETCPSKDLIECIRRNKHRFHNNKAAYIVRARENVMKDFKTRVQHIIKSYGQKQAREWLVKSVKGIGYKESSHFLRNVGYFDLAILDRHILNLMVEDKIISEKPKTLTKKVYYENEEKLADIAAELKMTQAELDMSMWYLKTGEVLK